MTTQHDARPETGSTAAETAGRAPLLVTLLLADPAQGMFQALRQRHFPSGRNHIPAHVSLFHALPGAELEPIRKRLRQVGDERFAVRVREPVPTGRGVSFPLEAPALLALRAALAHDWAPWLTPQDRQGYRPHVTVQNKVEPDVAKATLERLRQGFVPFGTEATSLLLWRYLGGPWEALGRFDLAAPSGTTQRRDADRRA